jgi:hypothetical protein
MMFSNFFLRISLLLEVFVDVDGMDLAIRFMRLDDGLSFDINGTDLFDTILGAVTSSMELSSFPRRVALLVQKHNRYKQDHLLGFPQ